MQPKKKTKIQSYFRLADRWIVLIVYLLVTCAANGFHTCVDSDSTGCHAHKSHSLLSNTAESCQSASYGWGYHERPTLQADGMTACLTCFYLAGNTAPVKAAAVILLWGKAPFQYEPVQISRPSSFALSLPHNRAPPVSVILHA